MASALSDSGVNPLTLPPAVEYPLAPARGLRWLLMLAWSWIMAVQAYWLVVSPAGDWRPGAALLVSLLVAALAWRSRPLTQSGMLVWDGSRWWWERASVPVAGHVRVRLDLQSGLLLHFASDAGARHWFWLERASDPGRWLAVRRAAHAGSAEPAASQPVSNRGAMLR